MHLDKDLLLMKHHSLLALAFCIGGLEAHMQLANPYPIRSPFDTTNTSPFNDYMRPLKRDASDYPCKSLVVSNSSTTTTTTTQYRAGNEYTASLAGGTTHGGGSCQFSLSYDDGETFKVIRSVIGSCPLKLSYRFTVPPDAPAGRALFAWTWFNRLGHREMYMNCASVHISNNSDGGNDTVDTVEAGERKQHNMSFDDLPTMFIANIYSEPSQCETIEGQDVVFADPGPSVEYGDGWQFTGESGYICHKSSPTFLDNSSPSPSPSQSQSQLPSPKETATAPTTATTPQRHALSTLSTSYVTRPKRPPTSTDTNTTGSRSTAIPTLATNDPCVPGTLRCDSIRTYSLCTVEGVYVFMGEVINSAHCKDGNIQFETA